MAQETVVSKLRNILTPHYSLPQMIVYNEETAKSITEMGQIILETAQQALKNSEEIHLLLTKLEEIESKHL
jgi:hypothetical protein